MKRFIWLVIGLFCLSAVPVFGAPLQVEEGVITTKVVDLAPVDEVQTFQADVGVLFCFTRIVGAGEDMLVTHRWLRNGEELAAVTLPVRSPNWRTYSSKRILPEWTGEWQVVVEGPGGEVLKRLVFTLI